MRRMTGVLAGLLLLLGVAAPASGRGRPEPPDRVLIIVIDQFRPDLVDTMAAPYSADAVDLLDTSYGVAGDHGGAQRPVREIPVVFGGAGVGSRDSRHPLRSVDILPTILRAMDIKARPGLDGKAVELPRRR